MLRDLVRARDLSVGFAGGGRSNLDDGFLCSFSTGGASVIGVSSVLMVAGGVPAAGVVDSLFTGDLLTGDCDLIGSNFASLAATGSRGTSDLGGWAFRIGGSSDPDRSRAGRCRAFLISSLSWRSA
jgi:hypothetical protein